MVSSKQPTIAIITAQYCEKIAVDAMLENKETFVRYTTVGKLAIFAACSVCVFLFLLVVEFKIVHHYYGSHF